MKALRLTEEQYARLMKRGEVTVRKRGKYGNVLTTVDGIEFASAREARRWQELRLLEQAGEISGLQRQVRFPLRVSGVNICAYIADFVYRHGGKQVIEDAKGYRTAVYRIKCKLMLACHGVEILES